jgi:sterol 3beta-glucosyltransferase
MKITILSWGSYGDINPFIALGLGLQKAGHVVNIATNFDYEEYILKWGLNFISVDCEAWYDDNYSKSQGQNPFGVSRNHGDALRSIEDSVLPVIYEICKDAEAIVFSSSSYAAYEASEKLQIPTCVALVMPMHQTCEFPSHVTPSNVRLGGVYNWLTYSFFYQLFWQFIRKPINQWRKEMLDLPPVPRFSHPLSRMNKQKLPFLYGFSPSFLPKPLDWPDWTHVTGNWFLDSPKDWQAPKELIDFLAAGSPPVYIGFGNRGNWEPEELTQIVLQALKISGKRGILLVGDDLIAQNDWPDEVFPIEWVPFDWLFPQMAAVVHHAGCGTIHAALRAGVPNVIVPEHAENFLWAYRVVELGLGVPPIQRKQLSAEKLAAAIQTITSDKTMQVRALEMSKRIQAEDGVAQAVEILERHLQVDDSKVTAAKYSNFL